MHGIIFAELKKYADARLGFGAWNAVLADAGMPARIHLPVQEYPDSEAVALVSAAAKRAKAPVDAVLQDFGEFIVPDLLSLYGSLLDKRWRTLDVIEHTEETIHRAVRVRNPGARPPQLRSVRVSPSHVRLHYSSSRRMCGVAKGISRGLARHFGEAIEITEGSCMNAGQPECVIDVHLATAP